MIEFLKKLYCAVGTFYIKDLCLYCVIHGEWFVLRRLHPLQPNERPLTGENIIRVLTDKIGIWNI